MIVIPDFLPLSPLAVEAFHTLLEPEGQDRPQAEPADTEAPGSQASPAPAEGVGQRIGAEAQRLLATFDQKP